MVSFAVLMALTFMAMPSDADDTQGEGGDTATPIEYIDYEVSEDGTLTKIEGYKEVEEVKSVTSDVKTWEDGWYVVDSVLDASGITFTVSGNVHLILMDECSLTASNIVVNEGNSITIYGQSQGTGLLKLTGVSMDATLGGEYSSPSGKITINGGTVKASNNAGAAIGGGNGENGGSITISGGVVKATASDVQADSIGGGKGYSGSEGSFSTGESGNAVLFADRIDGFNPNDVEDIKAIIFQEDKGTMYGTSVTPTESFDMDGYELVLGEDQEMVLDEGVEITGGTIKDSSGAQYFSVVFRNGSEVVSSYSRPEMSLPPQISPRKGRRSSDGIS